MGFLSITQREFCCLSSKLFDSFILYFSGRARLLIQSHELYEILRNSGAITRKPNAEPPVVLTGSVIRPLTPFLRGGSLQPGP